MNKSGMSMPRWGRMRALALLTGLALALAARAEPGVSATEIVIGQSISLNDGKNGYGVAAHEAMRMVLDKVNANGGVHGRRIVLRTLDDHDKGSEAEVNARQLTAAGIFALFGTIEGGPSTAVAQVATETGTPFIGPMAGSPVLWRPHSPMVFPVRAEHRAEFQALLSWAAQIGLKTVGLIHADTPVGQQHLSNVRAIAKALNLQVTHALPFKSGMSDADIDAAVRSIAQASPDVMLNHGGANVYARIIQRAKAAGLKTTFMGVNSGSSQIARQLGEDAKGLVFSQVVPSPWERKHLVSREYQDDMRAAHPGMEPRKDLSYGGLEGYLTAKVLVHALKAAGPMPTRASMVAALESRPQEVSGLTLRYLPGSHEGVGFVDLSMVARDGRFIH